MSVKERLKKFIGFNGLSVREFERNCNLSNGTVNGIRNNISPKIRNMILEKYPTLNLLWLITGEGEMLQNSNQKLKAKNKDNFSFEQVSTDYSEIIKENTKSFQDLSLEEKLNYMYQDSIEREQRLNDKIESLEEKLILSQLINRTYLRSLVAKAKINKEELKKAEFEDNLIH